MSLQAPFTVLALCLLVLVACPGGTTGTLGDGGDADGGGHDGGVRDGGPEDAGVFPTVSSFSVTCDPLDAGYFAYAGGCEYVGTGCMSCVLVGVPNDGGEPVSLFSDTSTCTEPGACSPVAVSGDLPVSTGFLVVALQSGLCERDGGALQPGDNRVSGDADILMSSLTCPAP